jgi:hypothetical protein
MEAVLIIATLAWAGYKFVKFNTSAGAEAVRAFVYLEGLKRGETAERANVVVDIDLPSIDSDQLRRVTERIQTIHGKQLPLMSEAYRRGMHPKVPTWYYNFVSKVPASPSVRREYPAKSMEAAPAGEAAKRNFSEFNKAFIGELKKLSVKSDAEIHYIELMDDEPTRRAFTDGIDPIELAASAWCQFVDYEEYHASVRSILAPHFKDMEMVDQLLRMKNELIRAGHSSGVHPKLIAEKYHNILNVIFKQSA